MATVKKKRKKKKESNTTMLSNTFMFCYTKFEKACAQMQKVYLNIVLSIFRQIHNKFQYITVKHRPEIPKRHLLYKY